MRTTKSPKKVLRLAKYIGDQALKQYSHKFSPKTFTQPQLFACLVLKEFLQLDYRKVEALLEDCEELRKVIELRHTPDHSTLHQADKRIMASQKFHALL